MMRIPIREQLALLILLSALIGLAVISIATWVSNHVFVLSICSSRLSLTASLKAAQLASNLDLMQTTASFLTTRVIIQGALERYNQDGNDTADNWVYAIPDMAAAIGNGGSVGQALLLQGMILPKSANGPGGSDGLLNTTNPSVLGTIHLPYMCPNGVKATLGMTASDCGGRNYGYPPNLYPNLTYPPSGSDIPGVEQSVQYKDVDIGPGGRDALMLGPWKINSTFSLVSITLPVLNNTDRTNVLGYLTAVMDARLIQSVVDSTEGLENTGETLLVGPATNTNIFPKGITYQTNDDNPPSDFLVHYIVPLNASFASRHPDRTVASGVTPWKVSEYPTVELAITQNTGEQDNSGAMIKGHNEAGAKVASGYALPQTQLVDWVVVVEQSRSEVWAPINHLRDILLACVFGTLGLMVIIAFPIAHFSSLPIQRLREATAKSVEPPGMSQSRSSIDSFTSMTEAGDGTEDLEAANGTTALARKEGFTNPLSNWRQKRHENRESRHDRRDRRRKREFRIPGKVKERKHLVKDELSDLTTTFNEMSDELMMQYTKLEERVQLRTAELEQSKKAAEAANESKTLFIANISHELKTPLNGILGMCAVCMQEDDPIRLKRSLGIIYKSGDLLLNLLTDLLTFSKNQVGQHLSLDEKEFKLRDVSSQILAIFDKQAKEGRIDLRVEWEGVQNLPNENSSPERTDYGPNGTGRLKDMVLWGDLQRILQVVINLVSNSLKFTPSGGAVVLTIRCLPDIFETASRKASSSTNKSRQSRQVTARRANGSDSMLSGKQMATANSINAKDKPHALASLYASERASTPPPGVFLYFEFEVNDTGPGISDELQAKIFEPFVQGDLGLSKKFGGTGLGLSICSQLAGLMRGSIGVQSTVGVGSTFAMKIPLRHLKTRADSSASSGVDVATDGVRGVSLDDGDWTPARHSRHLAGENDEKASINTGNPPTPTPGSDSQPRLVGLSQPFFAASQPLESPGSQPAAMEKIAADAARSGHKIRVLVAEDNKVNQEVVLRMLKLEDIYDVTVAKDGQEALDFVKASMNPTASSGNAPEPYNLIFMDVQMPNVDGLQSTRLIREIGYQAPIVALTAFAEESNIKDCLDSGMNYFLSKPIRRPQLKKVLKEYCAPIPEENEEAPPEIRNQGSQNTTIIMVNGNGAPVVPESERVPKVEPVATAKEQPDRPESPVSPLTSD